MSVVSSEIHFARVTREQLQGPALVEGAERLGMELPQDESLHHLYVAELTKGEIAAIGVLLPGQHCFEAGITLAVDPELNGYTQLVKDGILAHLAQISRDSLQRPELTIDEGRLEKLRQREGVRVDVETFADGEFLCLTRQAINAAEN